MISDDGEGQDPGAGGVRGRLLQGVIYAVSVFAVTFNGILAFVNAHGLHAPKALVVLCEIAILGISVLAMLVSGKPRGRDAITAAFLFVNVAIALLISIGNDTIFVDALRNFAIIAVFSSLGLRCTDLTLRRVYMTASVVVLAVLCVEVLAPNLYVQIFQPAAYFEASRGVAQRSYNDTGLFANSLGYSGRFTLGLYSGPRTSSIFMEQVSLAGYAAVLTVYLLAKWENISWPERAVHAALLFFILATNNSRTSTALLAISVAGYWIFPLIPRYLSWALAPAVLSFAFLYAGPAVQGATYTDDLKGRLGITATDLYYLSPDHLLGGWLAKSQHSFDSGYVYIIASSTLFGLLAMWLFSNVFPGGRSRSQLRCLWGFNLYVWLWLAIGGTAIFTMKTSAVLWLVVGQLARVRARDRESGEAETDPYPQTSPAVQLKAAPSG